MTMKMTEGQQKYYSWEQLLIFLTTSIGNLKTEFSKKSRDE